MKWRMPTSTVAFLFVANLLSMNQASANKVKKFDLEPAGGVVVRVISDKGKRWNRLEKGQKPVANLMLNYECRFKHKLAMGPAAKASISVSGPLEAFWEDNFLIKGEDAKIVKILLSPRQGAGKGPVKMCNDRLGSLVIETGKSKEYFLARGFTIKTNELVGKGSVQCNKVTKAGVDDLSFKNATLPLTVQCVGYKYPGQGKGKPAPSGGNPAPAPKPKRTKLGTAIKKLELRIKPDRFSGLCPAKLQVDASVTLNYPTEIQYRYTGDKGHKSPVFTLKNKGKAGSWNLAPWNRYIKPPKVKNLSNLAGSPGKGDYLHKGWMKIKVLSPKAMTSKAALFEFRCKTKPNKRPTPGTRDKLMKMPGASGMRPQAAAAPTNTRQSLVSSAPSRQPVGRKGLKKDLLKWAEKVERSKVLTRPLVMSSRRGTGDSIDPARLKPLVNQFRRLHKEILRSRADMSPVQAESFEKKLNGLVSRMDRQTRKACNGKPSKGSLAACMCDCGEAYQGWGKGRGWNRFICKTGCLTAKTLGK